MPWPVPADFVVDKARFESTSSWVAGLGVSAARIADAWGLTLDGPAWTGHMSCVWPVLGPHGESLVLKMTHPGPHRIAESAALQAWAPCGVTVTHVTSDVEVGAFLLQRLDASRSLEHEPIDEAVNTLASLMAALQAVPPPAGVPDLGVEVERIVRSIRRNLHEHPGVLAPRLVDVALATLDEVAALCGSSSALLLHGDLHFLNVLHTLPGQPPGWRVIDPLPSVGIPEWDITAMLRNRIAEALATGDPDRALRRRVDVVSAATGMSTALARRVAQAVAVDNLSWLLPRQPGHMFVAPYSVMVEWTS